MRVRRIAGALGAALFALSACSPDGPPTSPEPTDVMANAIPPCPVGGLCGSTNGVIHDGTRNETLVAVPGDPSPGAPGVWLGDTLAGRWCYADYNSFITDADRDCSTTTASSSWPRRSRPSSIWTRTSPAL